MGVSCQLRNSSRGASEFRLKSRWLLVFAGVRCGWHHLPHRLAGQHHNDEFRVDPYGPKTAFGLGMIHGVGGETGNQALLIAAVGGAVAKAWHCERKAVIIETCDDA